MLIRGHCPACARALTWRAEHINRSYTLVCCGARVLVEAARLVLLT